MAILQYYCPKHHTTKRKTRLDGFISWGTNIHGEPIEKADFKIVTPICQICREKMIYLDGEMPKKSKNKSLRRRKMRRR